MKKDKIKKRNKKQNLMFKSINRKLNKISNNKNIKKTYKKCDVYGVKHMPIQFYNKDLYYNADLLVYSLLLFILKQYKRFHNSVLKGFDFEEEINALEYIIERYDEELSGANELSEEIKEKLDIIGNMFKKHKITNMWV